MLRAMIVNEYDVSTHEGLLIDLDVCRLLKAHCYGVPVAVTDNGRVIGDLSDEVAKYLLTRGIGEFDVLKSTSVIRADALEQLMGASGGFKFRTLVICPRTLRDGNLEALTNLARYADLIVVSAEHVTHLAERLGVSVGSVYDAGYRVWRVLGARSLLVANSSDSTATSYLSILYEEGRYLQVASAVRCSIDLAATYLTIGSGSGDSLGDSLKKAIGLCEESSKYGLRVNDRVIPVVFFAVEANSERYRVLTRLREAVRVLEENSELVAELVPEVQMNIAYALPKHYLRGADDVAAIPGRIVRVGNRVKAVEHPDFGVSRHLARALLRIMEYDPSKRSIANIRFDREVLAAAEELGYTVSFYDRSQEPPEVKATEGATIPWGVDQAVRRVGKVPDVIYHTGDYGKEAMITVVGRDPVEVVDRILRIAKALRGR